MIMTIELIDNKIVLNVVNISVSLGIVDNGTFKKIGQMRYSSEINDVIQHIVDGDYTYKEI